jgi:hypothetical protein
MYVELVLSSCAMRFRPVWWFRVLAFDAVYVSGYGKKGIGVLLMHILIHDFLLMDGWMDFV